MPNSWKAAVAGREATGLIGFLSDPWKAIVVGIVGIGLFGYWTIGVFFFSYRRITPSDIELVRGKVARAEVQTVGRSNF